MSMVVHGARSPSRDSRLHPLLCCCPRGQYYPAGFRPRTSNRPAGSTALQETGTLSSLPSQPTWKMVAVCSSTELLNWLSLEARGAVGGEEEGGG
jgi:hypothetical protein